MSAFNTDSSLVYSKDDYKIPLSHTGYLKKRGQRIKTWKRRYVVVELGRLTYFEKSNGTDEPPYGLGLKGSLTLNGYEVEDGPKDTMLMLTHKTEKRELLVEAEHGADEAENWRALFEHHIQFCDENPHLFLQVGATFQEDEAKRAAVATKFRDTLSSNRVSTLKPFSNDGDNNDENEEENGNRPISNKLSAPVPIQLNPGFVIKSKRVNGLKVFINVCDHDSIPITDKKRGNKRWPIFVLSPSFNISVDKNAEECHVLDVCVHPSVMEECQQDSTGEAKDEICMKIMDAIIAREKKDKMEYLIDKTVFSFPRLTKKYKGDVVTTFLIPRNIQKACKNTSVFTAIDINDHVSPDEMEEEQEPIDIDADPFAPKTTPNENESKSNQSKSASRKTSIFFNSGIPKRFITINAERKTGAVIRDRPAKAGTRVKTLPQNAKTYCYGARKIDGIFWYRLLDGWTTALTDGGQRMIKPVCAEQPIASDITGVNLVEKEEKGFIFSTTIQKLTFSIQLTFPREALLRLQRSYDDFYTLYEGLKEEQNLQLAKPFPEYGLEDLRNGAEIDVDFLLQIMEDLDLWLKRLIEEVSFDSGTSMRKFLTCTEADCKKMDADLSAEGGLDGAWPLDYN